MEWNGLPPDAKLFDTREVPDRNPDINEQIRKDATEGRPRWHEYNSMLVEEAYWHPDGYFVWLRPDTARSYTERHPNGNKEKRGVQKAHFNVYYEKDSGIEETDQHHTFNKKD